MINVVAMNYVKKDKLKEFLTLAKELERQTNANDEGCIRYELVQDASDPYTFAFLEAWESKDMLDKHMVAKHFTEIVPQFADLMEKTGGINLFTKVD